MGIFGKLRLPAWDQAEGNPHVTPGLQLLAAEDWDGLAAIYRSLAPSDRYHFIRSGSVSLNRFRGWDKWISASVMLRPGLAAAG